MSRMNGSEAFRDGAWRQFVISTLLSAIVGIFGLIAFNMIVDDRSLIFPGHKSSGSVMSYVNALLASKNALHYPSYDYDRAVKNQLAVSTRASCLVTGSSREMQINLKNMSKVTDYECPALSNLAVSGGSLEDFAILASIILSDTQQHTIFVGLSAWMMQFGSDHRAFEDQPAISAAAHMFGLPLDVGAPLARSLKTIASLEYTRINIISVLNDLKAERRNDDLAQSVLKPIGDKNASLNPDGTLNYPATYSDTKNSRPMGNGSYKLDLQDNPDARDALIAIVKRLQNAGHRIVFLLTPYHPQVWALENEAVNRRLMRTEAAYRSIGRELGIHIIGGYDPRPFDLSEDDFLDDLHPKREAFRKLHALEYR